MDATAPGVMFLLKVGNRGEGWYQAQEFLDTQTGLCLCVIGQNIVKSHLQLQKTKKVALVFPAVRVEKW